MPDTRTAEYDQGYQDNLDGLQMSDNPYPTCQPEYYYWLAGWAAAQADRIRKDIQ